MIWSPTTKRYAVTLGALIAAIGLGHVLLHLSEASLQDRYGRHVTRWLDMNAETSIATWFSVGLLLITAFVSVLAAVAARQRRERAAWASLAIAILLLSLDEKISIHEHLPELLGMRQGNLISHEWLIPGVAVAGAAFIALLFLLRPLPGRTKVGLLLAAVVFGVGAVGMEFVSGLFIRALPGHHVLVRLLPVWELVEETLEMVGVVIAFLVVLRHLERTGVYDVERWRSESSPERSHPG